MENNNYGYIYVIREIPDEGVYKIGKTNKEPGKRLSSNQVGNYRKLEYTYCNYTEDYHNKERMLHTVFYRQKVRGEWFRLSRAEYKLLLECLCDTEVLLCLYQRELKNKEEDVKKFCYDIEHIDRETYRKLITLADINPLNKLQYTYSFKNWVNDIDTEKIKSKLNSFLSNIKPTIQKVLIQCPIEVLYAIEGRRYEKWLIHKTSLIEEKHYNRNLLIFLENPYKDIRDTEGIDSDTFAISELLKFINRSAITKGEHITLILPSERMRILFEQWLNK